MPSLDLPDPLPLLTTPVLGRSVHWAGPGSRGSPRVRVPLRSMKRAREVVGHELTLQHVERVTTLLSPNRSVRS